MIVEGFDVKVIRDELDKEGLAYGKDDKSLVLIEKLLTYRSGSTAPQRLEGLRTVQLIRSKVKAHSRSREATRLAQEAVREHETFGAHFEHVCRMVRDELHRIERVFS